MNEGNPLLDFSALFTTRAPEHERVKAIYEAYGAVGKALRARRAARVALGRTAHRAGDNVDYHATEIEACKAADAALEEALDALEAII